MIISRYDGDALHDAFGIDMSTIHELGVGAGWARVAPGVASDPHQHDETETFVIVRGAGELVVDGARHPVGPGTVAQFEPFETHVIENTGGEELIFATFYWRDAARAEAAAGRPAAGRRRFGERPLFVFSTPPTPNGDLHLGHLSGPYLGADVFVRYQRMNGNEAWHLTGSDDFQSYVVGAARRENETPEKTAAFYSAEIAATLELMDIPLDQYTVTNADPAYPAGLRGFFSRVAAAGPVAPRETPALFDGETGEYLYEVDVHGGCPTCGAPEGGNICEECGEPNTCVELVEPRSARSEAAPRTGGLVRYTLPLHEFRTEIEEHHRLGRTPARLRELAERVFRRTEFHVPVSHPAPWGVPPAEDAVPGQVIWVWPEMSYGFLHGIEALGERLGRGWRALEPQQDWKIVHFFGYDNSFYHAILYPVLYRLAFPGWTPDIDYHVNEFLLLDGAKFSTSRRHAIWGKEILSPETVDSVRYFLSSIRSEGRRTNFERPAYEAVLRETLIGTWQDWLDGLGRRIERAYGGTAPDAGVWTPEHTAFLASLGLRLRALEGALGQDGFSLNRAAAELDGIVRDTRRFAGDEARIAAVPACADESRTVIALELAAARLLARCAYPVMPRFATRLAAALGLEGEPAWPGTVELLTPGTRVGLAGQVYFADPAGGEVVDEDSTAGWLARCVRENLRLDAHAAVLGRSLADLGAESLQLVALQYLILQRLDLDVPIADLAKSRTIRELADHLDAQAASGPVPA